MSQLSDRLCCEHRFAATFCLPARCSRHDRSLKQFEQSWPGNRPPQQIQNLLNRLYDRAIGHQQRDGLAWRQAGRQAAPCINVTAALGIADYGSVIETDRIVLKDTAEALQNDEEVKKAYISA